MANHMQALINYKHKYRPCRIVVLAMSLTLSYGWLRGYYRGLLLDLKVCAFLYGIPARAKPFESSALRQKETGLALRPVFLFLLAEKTCYPPPKSPSCEGDLLFRKRKQVLH